MKVRGFHHQSIPLVVANRVTQPLLDISVIAITQTDNAGVMIHLCKNHDIVFGLHNAAVVVVKHRQHRRPTRRTKPNQTTLAHRANFGPIEAATTPSPGKNSPLRAFGPGQSPIIWLDDYGAADLTIDLCHALARIHPESVIPTDVRFAVT